MANRINVKIKKMKKVGIITFHFVNNFGGALQAYALAKTLKNKCDAEVEIIDYRNWFIRFTDMVRLLPISTNIKEIISGFKTMNQRASRRHKFGMFTKTQNKLTRKYLSGHSLRKDPPQDDKYVCGSDQIWNPVLTFGVSPNYFLQFEKNKNNRIAYAPSIGTNSIPNRYIKKISKYIDSIGHLSIREKSGQELIKKWTGREADRLIDPTFLLEKEDWNKVAVNPLKADEPYILLYIMQKDEEVYEYARKVKEKLGIKLIEISRYGYNPGFVDETLIDVGPAEFLGLFRDATFVCTNSYHGLAYSIIYEKEFCLIPCKRFRSRIENMYDLLQIKQEVANENWDNLTATYDKKFVHKVITKEKNKAIKYLNNALKDEVIPAGTKNKCCGCEACVQACPSKCIEVIKDEEGFVYPKVNEDKCVKCNLCNNVCPIDNNLLIPKNSNNPIAIGGSHKDEKILEESSSGGAFSLFANKILSNGGAVCGCTLDEENKAKHIIVEKKVDLIKLKGSKYVQSRIGNCYIEIKKRLSKGQEVLFVGTPCEVAGLYTFLQGKEYNNLLTMDFICHGTPSPMVFEDYIKNEENKRNSKISLFKFRNKDKGWNQTGLQLGTYYEFKSGKRIRNYPAFKDSYMNAFLDDLCLRPSCYDCSFKKIPKVYADITVADFWGVDYVDPVLNNKMGTSLLLINTKKGESFWEKVNENFIYKKVDYEKAITYNPTLIKSSTLNKNRSKFFEDYKNNGFNYCKNKYMSMFVWAFHKVIKIAKNTRLFK